MNKRLIKKMIKNKEAFNGVINASGNKGGDILTIYDNLDGTLKLTSGSSCIINIDKTVPVEFLTGIISNAMRENGNDINTIIEGFGWNECFTKELKSKVK